MTGFQNTDLCLHTLVRHSSTCKVQNIQCQKPTHQSNKTHSLGELHYDQDYFSHVGVTLLHISHSFISQSIAGPTLLINFVIFIDTSVSIVTKSQQAISVRLCVS